MKVFNKVKNRIENSKLVKNPIFLVIGLIAIILVIALIYFIFLKYSPIMNFKYEGYAISGKEITENLLGSGADESRDSVITNKNIELAKIEEQGTIFKKLNAYFVGNKEKTEINLNYPIYINGNSAIYNLSENSTLISKDFEEIAGYPNLSISEGKIYDGNNLERADGKEYIFVKTADEIYINLNEIKIKTTVNEYTIPVNSIIAFSENSIRYYSINNNVLVFNQINDIDNNSNVQIVENNYTYEELLTKLEIIKTEGNNPENAEKKDDIMQEDTSKSDEDLEKIENDNTIEQEQSNETNTTEEPQNGYVKPEVSVEDFTAEVYTAKSTLTIKDPAGKIVEAPTFEIYKDGKMYLRRTFSNSGEITITGLVPETTYEITGKFIYINEEGKKVENTFYEGTFTTKGYEELGSIDITKENGEIYSNKIQLAKVKITSDLNAEVIKGINQVEIETGEIRTVLKNNQVNALLRGEEITIESSEGLKSNSKINYAIKFYDKNGIELKVNNSEGKTRTSKEVPTAKVSIKEQDIVSVTLKLNLTNKDNVELENYKYIVTRPNGEIVKEERLAENEKEIVLDDLDQNQYYKIGIYADYNLNDNKGIQKNVEIGNLVFATQPISTLGSLELIVENKELTSTTSTISYKIDEERADKRLIQILNELKINIKNGDTIVRTDTLTDEEIENLRQAGTKEIKYENLKSNTTYTIEITGKVQLGNTQESIPVTYNYKEFTTLKIPAKVEIKNQFVTGNLIDFDVRIEDIDNSVLNNKVRMELRNSSNDLIDLQEVTTNEDFIRKIYEKLEENQAYKLSFYADQYNEGNTDATYKVNYLIKEIEIITEPGISGSIGLTELTRKATGKNLVDVASETKWYVYPNFNTNDYYGKEYNEETKILTLGGHGCWRRAVYDLREYVGQEVTMSFKARKVDESQSAFIQNSKKDENRIAIEGLTTDWKDFQYTLTIDDTGYLGFFTYGGNGIEIKELQIELGNKKTSYEEFNYVLQSNYNINLEDRRDEITTNAYYIKVYEDNNLIKTDRYEEIPEENKIENAIKTYETQAGKQYKVELVIKIKEREYVLSELEYNTQDTEEIKGIYNKEDFLEIQPRGHYIVLGDIDLRGVVAQYRFGNDNLRFEGKLDFNGYKLIRDASSTQTIMYVIGETGVIENIVLDLYLNNNIEMSNFTGVAYRNYGTIRNIQVNIKECTNNPNIGMTLVSDNRSVVENFIVNLEVPLYVDGTLGLVVMINRGTVKNGYLKGEDIIVTNKRTTNKNIGGVVYDNIEGGQVENIYNLINMKLLEEKLNDNTFGSIVSLNRYNSIIKNCYSTGTIEKINPTNGPVIGISYEGAITENIYYFNGETKNNTYNIKTTPLALWDTTFQNQILNSENAFNVDELINKGYFPLLNMPTCMPNQSYIQLPEVEDKDLADILSTEVLEQGSNTARVRFVVNNPSSETIIKINIENLTCTIESQEYSNGQSIVIATVNNPIICTSNYSVLSITTKGAFTQEYTRSFNKNERIVPIELFKEINTVEDWIAINKSPTENYMLMNDLDFINQGDNIKITATYTGKLEGNNHTLKNINVKSWLFGVVKGKLQNINIENITITKSTSGNIGIISNTNYANIENIFVKNEKILLDTGYSMEVHAGGLIGYMERTNLRNIVITNLDVKIADINGTFSVGGLIGYIGYYNMVENSFVQDLNVNETASLNIEGIGGIAGATVSYNAYKNITNCYVVGSIKSTKGNIGGIVGRAEAVDISNCISKVNIIAQDDNISGVVGKVTAVAGNSANQIENNLVLGNIYSTNTDIQNINRIVGSGEKTENNYAYEEQLINGEILSDGMGANLISYNEIFTENTYKNVLNSENQYDFTELKDEILPKLLSKEGDLLPNQVDNKLEKGNVLEIESIEAQKTGTNTLEARIELKNSAEVTINKIIIDGIDAKITRNITQNGKTYIDISGAVTKYFDNYKIEQIEYIENNGENNTANVDGKINLQYFKEIYTFEDWQSMDTSSYQNYRLMSDIDFAGKTNIKNNILVNRLETDGPIHTLKNINLEYSSSYNGLIKGLKNSLENVNFENITITNTTANSSYIGVIVNSTADRIQKVNLKNITINAKGDYVGFIANAEGEKISNVNLDTVNLTGKARIGGLAGQIEVKNIENIYGTNIQIEATENYVGGAVGYVQNVANGLMKNVTIEGNSKINSITGSIVGGVIGQKPGNSTFSVQYIYARNLSVKANDYVGGIAGTLLDAHYLYAENVRVEGKSYVGGIQGNEGSVTIVSIKDSTIKATGDYVGGVAGKANWNFSDIQVINTKIESTGNYVGGLAGTCGTNLNAYNIYAQNCTVEGNSYVGGLTGEFTMKPLYRTYNNSKVTATNHTAGGIIGYLDNDNMTAVNNTSKLYYNYVARATVTAKSNVGGFIGNMTDDLYMPETYYYSNYIEVYLDSDDINTVSLGIGGRQNQNSYLKDTYYYKYSSINGTNPTLQNEPFIPEASYLIEEELKDEKTYTSKLKWSSNDWNFASLTNDRYPLLKTFTNRLVEQEGIDIPKDEEHIIGNALSNDVQNIEDNNEQLEQAFEYDNKTIETYSTYSSVTDSEGNKVVRNTKLYLKDNTLYAIPSVLSATSEDKIRPVANNLILDSYNGKEYETVLGSDGKIYDLKEPITYPENFVNENIESIGNNLNSDTKEVEVTYENGDKIKFNYQTGEIIFSSEAENTEKVGLFDYLKEKISEIGSANTATSQERTNKYEESKELQTKLEETSVEEAIEKQNNSNKIENDVTNTESNVTNNSVKETKYISVYNEKIDDYQIYNEEELLDTRNEEVVSENEKIEANNLKEYYASEGETKNTKMGIVWIVLSIIGVGIILFALRKNLKKKA